VQGPLSLGDQTRLIRFEEVLHLGLETDQLAVQRTKLTIISGQLSHSIGRLSRHPARGQLAIFTPSQADVRMAPGTLGAPAVGFSTARRDLGKGTSEQRLILEELIEQVAPSLLEVQDSLLQFRA
jgi:hypothetical protein